MIEFLNGIDTQVFLWFNGHHSPFFDIFMKLFTGRFIWIPMYTAIALMMWRAAGWSKFMFYILGAGLAEAITDQLCASYIRPAVERLRPSNLENALSQFTYIVGGYRGGSYGFPSCHAANSFALASFVALLVRRRPFVLFILGWAVLNSYSRLYLGVHYPGDLLVGSVIGSCVGAGCFLAVRRLADSSTPAGTLAERAETPLFTYHLTAAEGPALSLTRGFSLTATALVMIVAAATVCYIITRAAIG